MADVRGHPVLTRAPVQARIHQAVVNIHRAVLVLPTVHTSTHEAPEYILTGTRVETWIDQAFVHVCGAVSSYINNIKTFKIIVCLNV